MCVCCNRNERVHDQSWSARRISKFKVHPEGLCVCKLIACLTLINEYHNAVVPLLNFFGGLLLYVLQGKLLYCHSPPGIDGRSFNHQLCLPSEDGARGTQSEGGTTTDLDLQSDEKVRQ